MNTLRVWTAVALLCLGLSSIGNAATQWDIEEIIITTSPKGTPHAIKTFPKDEVVIGLDLENFGDEFVIQVISKSKAIEYKIECQSETSISISNEGPHLDLINWRHGYSPWRRMKEHKRNTFKCPWPDMKGGKPFPRTSVHEAIQAAGKVDDQWLQLMKKAKNLSEYPFDIGVSRLRFRISAKTKGNWSHIYQIVCMVPMGC